MLFTSCFEKNKVTSKVGNNLEKNEKYPEKANCLGYTEIIHNGCSPYNNIGKIFFMLCICQIWKSIDSN